MTTEVLDSGTPLPAQSVGELMDSIGRAAVAAAQMLAHAPAAKKNQALQNAADALLVRRNQLLAANARDLDAAKRSG